MLTDPELAERAFRTHGYKTAVIPAADLASVESAPQVATSVPVVNLSDGQIDYDQALMLDAEELAEGGIGSAYAELTPLLTGLGLVAATVSERITEDSYAVAVASTSYDIYGPECAGDMVDSWVRATFALFDIVNRQLMSRPRLLYALYGGNDLAGVLLSDHELDRARAALSDRKEWPYLPTLRPPHYGALGFDD